MGRWEALPNLRNPEVLRQSRDSRRGQGWHRGLSRSLKGKRGKFCVWPGFLEGKQKRERRLNIEVMSS